jgi:O-antigen/teichoic acid export membrane protein
VSRIRVTYSGLISFVVGLFSIGLGLIFMLVVTRTFSPLEYGTWGLINSLLIYGTILDPIVSYWTTREIARNTPSGKTSVFSSGVFSFGGIFIFIIAAFLISSNSDIDYEILSLALILVPFMYLNKVLIGINNGWKPEITSFGMISSEISKIPLVIFFVYFLDLGVPGIIYTILISYVVNNSIQIFFARKKLKEKFQFKFLKKWFKLSWLTMYPRLANLLYRSDVIIFSVMTGSVMGIAYYSSSLVIASVIGYAAGISASSYGKLLESNDGKFLQKNVTQFFYFSIPLLAIAIYFAKPGLFALNPAYEIAFYAVIFLSIRTLFFTINTIFTLFLNGIEKVDLKPDSSFKHYIKSNLFFLPSLRLIQHIIYIVSLFTMIFILQTYDVDEIELVIYWALISLIVQIPFTAYIFRLIKKNFDLVFDFSRILKYFIVSFGIFGLSYFFMETFLIYDKNIFVFLPNLLLYIILGILGYLGITYLIDKNIRLFFNAIVNELKSRI